MLNKKGFTLVEIVVTLGILAVVLVFMMNTLVTLKNQSIDSTQNKEIMITQAIISRALNKDIIDFGGITRATCPVDNPTCTINYKQGNVRNLLISEDHRTFTYSSNIGIILKRTLEEGYVFGDIRKENYNYPHGLFIKIVIPIYQITQDYNYEDSYLSTEEEYYYFTSQLDTQETLMGLKYSIEAYSYLKN